MSALRSATLGTEADLHAAVPAWLDLWRRCPAASPFQHPAWLAPWWTTFHPGHLRLSTVVADGQLVALAPLYLEEGALGRRLLPLGMSVSDYLDVLVDPAWPDAGPALAGEIARSADASRIDLEELPPGAGALGLPAWSGWREAGVSAQSACPVLALGDTLEGSIPALKARKLRMARRRADRRSWRIEAATVSTAPDLLAALYRLHGARWKTRGEPGVLAHGDIRAFHAAVVPGLLADGVLCLAAVWLGETLAGVYYGFVHAGRAYAYLGGFDPAFAYESPGTLLMGHAIETAIAEGATEFHFLRGQEAYKYDWGAVDRWNVRRTLERDDG